MTLIEKLLERTTLRYMGDCKCGNCQLVPRELIAEAANTLASQAVLLDRKPETKKFLDSVS